MYESFSKLTDHYNQLSANAKRSKIELYIGCRPLTVAYSDRRTDEPIYRCVRFNVQLVYRVSSIRMVNDIHTYRSAHRDRQRLNMTVTTVGVQDFV